MSNWLWPLYKEDLQGGWQGGTGDSLARREWGQGGVTGHEQLVIYGVNKHNGSVLQFPLKLYLSAAPLEHHLCALATAVSCLDSGTQLFYSLMMGASLHWGPGKAPHLHPPILRVMGRCATKT